MGIGKLGLNMLKKAAKAVKTGGTFEVSKIKSVHINKKVNPFQTTLQQEKHINIPKGKFAAPSPIFDESPVAFQKAVRDNADDIKGIYDLLIHGELSKEDAFGYIAERLHKSFDISKYAPEIKSGMRRAYGEYRDYANDITINETLDPDMLLSQYTHEIKHFFQAKEANEAFLSAYGNLNLKFRAKAISELHASRHLFKNAAEYEQAVTQRADELKRYYENTNWNKILKHQEYKSDPQDKRTISKGFEYHNADIKGCGDNYHGNLLEREAYSTGTATYIELQKSVHGTINKKEYDLLNEINIVLHEAYNELPVKLQRLTREINIRPDQFIDNVKFITRELAGSVNTNGYV